MITTLLLCTVLYCANLQSIETVREIDYMTVDDREVAPVVDIAERVLYSRALEVVMCSTYENQTLAKPLQVEWGRIGVAGVY
jgi:hypothetical protein